MATARAADIAESARLESQKCAPDVVLTGVGDEWDINLPAPLKTYQEELEGLLGKVFSGCPRSRDNLLLAQQMTMNWCRSKSRRMGLHLDE